MKSKDLLKMILLVFCLIPLLCYSQDIKIALTKLETVNNKLVITYDFADDLQKDLFDVWIEITTLSGRRINARTLSGDIGDNLVAGKNKQIIWDFVADDIVMDEEINIEVKAIISRPNATIINKTGKGQALVLSAAFPGWGLSKLEPGKPYWLMGATAYLLAGSSVILNQMADKEYTKYSTELEQNLSDYSFNKSKTYNNLSKASAYAAIGIWSINLIWTAVKSPNINRSVISEMNRQRLNIYANYNHELGTTGFTIKYKF